MAENANPSRGSATVDLGDLIELVRLQGENGQREIAEITRLVRQQNADLAGALGPTEAAFAREYALARQKLSGPEEGFSLDTTRIRSIVPEAAPIGAEIAIALDNAGTVTAVGFAGPGDATVVAVPEPSSTNQVVKVKVPKGAVSGPISVETERGDPLSAGSFIVSAAPVVPAAREYIITAWEVGS